MRSKFTSREVWICVVLALVSRIAIAALFIQYKPSIIREPWTGTFARWAGDTPSYFEAVDSWLSGGDYAPDWRPPGYAFVYLLARLVAAPPQAADLIVVLQVLVSTVAALAIGWIGLELGEDRRLGALVFALYLIAAHVAAYDSQLATESLAVSLTVCVTALLLRLRTKQSARLAFAAGLLGLWIVFLRPVMGSVIAMMTLWILLTGRKRPQLAVLFALPLAVGAGLWGIRGLLVHGSFKPLGEQWAPYYRPVDRSLHSFVQSFGGSIVHWNPKAQIVWFDFLTSADYEVPKESSSNVSLPTDIYCSRVTPESLLAIKADLRRSLRSEIDRQTRDREQAEIAARLDAMTAAIRSERPFTYWVRAPIRIFLSHLIHSGTTHLLSRPWNRLGLPLLLVKVGLSAMYAWVVVFGFAGAARTFVADGDPWPRRLITAAFLVPLLVQTLLLRMDEYRYFAPSFPFALILAASATLSLVDRARGRRSTREKTV